MANRRTLRNRRQPIIAWGLRVLLPFLVLGNVTWLAMGATPRPALRTAGSSEATHDPSATSDKCANCHTAMLERMLSHPVGIVPGMAVPAELPLDSGRITCLTCHQDGGLAGHSAATQNHDGMLRQAAPLLCAQCHNDSAVTAKSLHPQALGRAHLNAPLRRTSTPGSSLDAESRTCLSCHDGTIATDVGSSIQSAVGEGEGENHPVGIPMENRNIPIKSSMRVTSPSVLNRNIRLFDGNVGCGSCHSPYSSEPQYLVMDNYGSRLCLDCHRGR